MLIWLVVITIVIVLMLSAHFKRYREADEKTLRPMTEWTIIANSGNRKHRERMAYSLIIQTGTILEGLKIMPLKSLRMLMSETPDISKAHFVLQILRAAADLYPTDEFLANSYETKQARTHMATCVELIIANGGARALARVAISARGEPTL
jgi:hypothetical protein